MAMKIYGDSISGNCLKIKYVCDILQIEYQWCEVDILKQASRTPEYLAMNPQGQVPVIQLDTGECIAQSNGIMRFLARGSKLLPEDNLAQARIDEWLFWEQYSHEPYIAVNRFQMKYLGKRANELESWRVERGYEALNLMEQHLQNHSWFANGKFSIADIALYAYTSMAQEGGFDLGGYPGIERWLQACALEIQVSE